MLKPSTSASSVGGDNKYVLSTWCGSLTALCRVSVARYHVVRSCCHWSPQQRPSVTELLRNLRAGEQSANGRTALRASQPIDIEKYLREAGFGETYNYTVLWLAERPTSLRALLLPQRRRTFCQGKYTLEYCLWHLKNVVCALVCTVGEGFMKCTHLIYLICGL